jgi:hypothetical protein
MILLLNACMGYSLRFIERIKWGIITKSLSEFRVTLATSITGKITMLINPSYFTFMQPYLKSLTLALIAEFL